MFRRAVPIWNDCFFPLVLITSGNLRKLPPGLTVFVGEIHRRLAVHRADTGGAADYRVLYRAVERFIAGIAQAVEQDAVEQGAFG